MRKGMGFCTGCRKADELMEKKHKFKLILGLNRNNPDHVRVAEILNRLGGEGRVCGEGGIGV